MLRWDMICQPNSVVTEIEGVIGEPGGVDGQNDIVARTPVRHNGRGLNVFTQVDVLARSRPQSFLHDRIEELGFSAVVEKRRWSDGLKSKIDADAVALIGSDLGSVLVESEPLLVVVSDQSDQIRFTEMIDFSLECGNHRADIGPPLGVEGEVPRTGVVP